MRIFRIMDMQAPCNVTIAAAEVGLHYWLYQDTVTAGPEGKPVAHKHLDFAFDLDCTRLQQQSDFADYGFLAHGFYPRSRDRVQPFAPDLARLVNIYPHTKATRMGLAEFFHARMCEMLIGVAVPFADSPLSEWGVMLPGQGGNLTVQGDLDVQEVGSLSEALDWVMPRLLARPVLRQDSPVVPVVFQLLDTHGLPATATPTLYFETTHGALLTQRAQVRNGAAVALVDTTGLPAGTMIKVKAGFKHMPGLADGYFTTLA